MLKNKSRGVIDMTGKRCGRLLIVERAGKTLYGGLALWICQCDCGKEIVTRGSALRRGTVTSCGCYRLEQHFKKHTVYGEAHTSWLYSKYRSDAKRKRVIFELSLEQFRLLISEPCFCCGRRNTNKMQHSHIEGSFTYNGIDRIDNTLGYIPGNVRTSCWTCNRMKRDLSEEEYVAWLQAIVGHNKHLFNGNS